MPKLPSLRAYRERAMLSQDELAQRAGIARHNVSRLENGQAAQYATVRKLAEALGVEPHALVGDPTAALYARVNSDAQLDDTLD